jgi:hypothetical protein
MISERNFAFKISTEKKYQLGLVRQFVNSSVPCTNQNSNKQRWRCSSNPRLLSRLFCRGFLPVQVESLIIPVGRGHGPPSGSMCRSPQSRSARDANTPVPPRGHTCSVLPRGTRQNTQLGGTYQPSGFGTGSTRPRPSDTSARSLRSQHRLAGGSCPARTEQSFHLSHTSQREIPTA